MERTLKSTHIFLIHLFNFAIFCNIFEINQKYLSFNFATIQQWDPGTNLPRTPTGAFSAIVSFHNHPPLQLAALFTQRIKNTTNK